MSAGEGKPSLKVNNNFSLLAPHFRIAVEKAIEECNATGLQAFVYEALRSPELQALYYARGRTIIPPSEPVTNAPTVWYSWHGYGLAVDVIHRTQYWKPSEGDEWFARVAAIFKKYDCNWGGDWKRADLPHFQWGRCRPSPSDAARSLISKSGIEAVWTAVGAVG